MKKILLFGATGNLGKEIAKEAVRRGYPLSAVVRNSHKAASLAAITQNCIVADVTRPQALKDMCTGFDIVISALGKSVSPNDKSKTTFKDIDLAANSAILEEAKKSGVGKFVYVSALHSEKYPHLEYFRVHHEFSERLKSSGINYSIIKPPAIFSAYSDVIEMAKKGQLMTIGAGDKKTNPIYEGDLAKICVDAIDANNAIIEAGGKNIYTRKQLNDIIQRQVNPAKKVRSVPAGLLKLSLPLIKLFDRNMYDKFAFISEVMQHDTIAPQVGAMEFEEYIGGRVKA
jgi:uncharacterized protein YbjT (DUF2867 family)